MRKQNPAIVAAESARSLAESALSLVCTSMPDARERLTFRDLNLGSTYTQHYALKLYGRARAHGGIIVVTFAYAGQSDSVRAFYFETWLNDWRQRLGSTDPSALAFVTAGEQLQRKADAKRAA